MSNETIAKLSEKLPVEAVQSTKGAETHKGYDTDGYSYQYCVDRFNDVCGAGWGFEWKILRQMEGHYKSGQAYHDVTVEVSIWVGSLEFSRACAGGHISAMFSDALKGAITNGFKKTAAFWGVGRDAYAGTIDDDNKPLPDAHENILPIKREGTVSGGVPSCPKCGAEMKLRNGKKGQFYGCAKYPACDGTMSVPAEEKPF